MSRSREQQQILFLLAGCARRRQSLSAVARAQLERADFDQLARDLAERRLLPLNGTRAIEAAPELIPERFRELGSLEFAVMLAKGADVAVSPGVGFGPGGDGHVRFALVENEQRIAQATRSIRKLLQG